MIISYKLNKKKIEDYKDITIKQLLLYNIKVFIYNKPYKFKGKNYEKYQEKKYKTNARSYRNTFNYYRSIFTK